MHKFFLLVYLLLGSLSCRSESFLAVYVTNIAALQPGSLQVIISRDERTANELPVLNRQDNAADAQHFLLRLPGELTGELNIGVAAFTELDGQGCILATADKRVVLAETAGATEVTLVALSPPACGVRDPLLISAKPGLSSLEGGQELELTGWGFRPGITTVTIGSTPATINVVSSTRIKLITPPRAGFGPVTVTARNHESQHSRTDLLRYFARTPSFNLDIVFRKEGSDEALSDLVVIPRSSGATFSDAVAWTNDIEGRVYLRKYTRTPTSGFVGVLEKYPSAAFPNDPSLVPVSLSSADLDNDGDYDLVVVNKGTNSYSIFHNDGSSFTRMAALPLESDSHPGLPVTPMQVETNDINGDGLQDFLVSLDLTAVSGRDYVTYYLNDGKGGFFMRDTKSAKSKTAFFKMARLRNITQKLSDMLIFNITEIDNMRILFNYKENGTFDTSLVANSPAFHNICINPSALEVVDVDRDGLDEIIVAQPSEHKLFVYRRTESAVVPVLDIALLLDASPTDIAAADLNGDGYSDLIVTTNDEAKPAESGRVHVFTNRQGAGYSNDAPWHFSFPAECPGKKHVVALNLDGDSAGALDILLAAKQPARPDVGCMRGFLNTSPPTVN